MAENETLNPTSVGAENEYDASEIQVLEGLEAVRKRPGMYIGSTSSSGLHHLVYEIVDNAIDEALAGCCTEILVQINADGTITVVDNGRGIPVDIQAQTGKPALEVVLMIKRPNSTPASKKRNCKILFTNRTGKSRLEKKFFNPERNWCGVTTSQAL